MTSSRKVVLYELLSLDGVAEDPIDFFPDWDSEMGANLADVIGSQDAVILGRRSWDEWAGYWPQSPIVPFAPFINEVTKYVATSRPLDAEWANSSAIEGGLADFLRTLKTHPGGNIGIHASISVAQTLLKEHLVDELRLVVAPTIAGSGRRLLDGLPKIALTSIRSSVSSAGYQILDYRVDE